MKLWKHLSLAAILASTLSAGNAFALSPSTSAAITKVTVDAPSYYKNTNGTLYIGKEQCQNLVKDDSRITITYQTRISPLIPGIYDSVMSFKVGRNTTAHIDCAPPSTLCSTIDPMYIKTTAKDIKVDIPFKILMGISTPSECDTIETELFVRARLKQRTTDTTFTEADAKFVIDAIGPNPPKLESASATESSLVVTLSGVGDQQVENYAAFYSETPLTAGQSPDPNNTFAAFGTKDTKQASMKVTMTAGKKYYVAISSHDDTGNFGPLSNVVEVTPIKTISFWDQYLDDGGQEDGGCSTTPKPLNSTPFQLLVLGAIGLILRRRNQHK